MLLFRVRGCALRHRSNEWRSVQILSNVRITYRKEQLGIFRIPDSFYHFVLNGILDVTRGYLFRNKVTHEGESWEPNEICVVLWVPGALEGKAPVSVCQIRNAPGNRHDFHLHVPFDQMCLKDLPVLLRGILIPSLFSGVFSLFSLCFASLLMRLFNIDGSSISLDDLAA